MGVNSSQIATRTNLLNNLGYRVSSGTTQCVTGAFLDSLNPKPSITTDNYSSYTSYSNFTAAEILNTTIVEKKYATPTIVPVASNFAINTEYTAKNFANTNVWSFDVSKFGADTDVSVNKMSISFSLSSLMSATSNKFTIEAFIDINNNANYNLLFGNNSISVPTASNTSSTTTITFDNTESKNVNFTSDYPNSNFIDCNGITRVYKPNTAYIRIILNAYIVDANGYRINIDIPQELKIKFNNAPIIATRCKSKLIAFDTLKTYKAVLPFRFGLSSKVAALSVDNMYLYGHVPTDSTGSSFTKVTLASHTGLSNTGKDEYKKYLDYIVINPDGTLTPEKFTNSLSYASFAAGTTGANRHWYVYLVNGSATDFNNVSALDADKVIEVSQAKSINAAMFDTNGVTVNLVNVIRDNWGVLLQVMT